MEFTKPKLHAEDIVPILKKYYSEIPDIRNISDLGGIPNNNFRVITSRNDIVLKIYSLGQSSLEHIKEEVNFILFLKDHSISTLSLLRGLDGEFIQFWNGYPVVCSHFIPGTILSNTTIDKQIASLIGKFTAEFISIASTYTPLNSTFRTDLNLLLEYVVKDIDFSSLDKDVQSDLRIFLTWWEDNYTTINTLALSYLPQMVHMDLWPPNIIMNNGSLYAIDYDDWLFTIPLFEIAAVILEYSMYKTATIDYEILNNLLASFQRTKAHNYKAEDVFLCLQYLCALWYGYNFVESGDYCDAKLYVHKFVSIMQTENHGKLMMKLKEYFL